MGEALIAEVTLEFFDSSMRHVMFLQVRLLFKRSITYGTFVRPFTGVKALVFLKEAGRQTDLSTLFTLVTLSTVCGKIHKTQSFINPDLPLHS